MADAQARRLRWLLAAGCRLPAAVLALSLALPGLLCAGSVRNNMREAGAKLDREASDFATALASRIQTYVDTLPGLRMFCVLQKPASDAEFLHYVQAILLQKRYPGRVHTFVADLVRPGQRAAYVQAVATAIAGGN